MIVRKILVPVDGSPGDRAALQTGFAVAGAFAAHVAGLHIRVEPIEAVPFVGEGMSGALVQELIELNERESAARASAARELFDSVQQASGFPTVRTPETGGPSAAWMERSGGHHDAIVRAGRLADLIVVGRPPTGGDAWAETTFSLALFETGRPVLVAGTEPGRHAIDAPHAVVAWNGSAEAARAIAAALPFLARATRVTVVAADGDAVDDRSLAELGDYLAWHGIQAERRLVSVRDSVGEVLTSASAGADLLVMGGYSHSRLRELILGGVTRHMLEKATLPLLVAH